LHVQAGIAGALSKPAFAGGHIQASFAGETACAIVGPMPRVSFTSNLRQHVDCPPGNAPGQDVRAVLDGIFAGNPRLRGYILDEQGRVRRHVNIFVNDRPVGDRIGLSDPVGEDDEIFVFQALSGGQA
jgi:hypothetical protein